MLGRALFTIGLVASIPALGSDANRYDLGSCIKAALRSSADLAAAAADLAGARARLAEAKAGRFGQGSYTQILGFVNSAHGTVTNPDPDTKRNDVFHGLGPFTRVDLELDIPVWTFGKLDSALLAAQKGLESEQARKESRSAEIVLNTKQLYYSLLLTRQLSLVLHDMLDTMDKAVTKVQERLDAESKSVTEIDLLKLKTGRAKFTKGVLEVDTAAGLTRSALARAVGLHPDDNFDITDVKLAPVDATIEPLAAYVGEAPSRRPEARALASGVAAQTARIETELASYYPMIFLTTGVRWAHAGNRDQQDNPFAWDEFNFVYPMGLLGIRWDLNFFMTAAKVEQARAELDRLAAQRRDADSGLELEIRKAYAEVTEKRQAVTAADEGRRAGRGLLILTVSNFDLGIGEAEELFKGLGIYTEASSDALRAVYDYNVAVATLSHAIGKELTNLTY